MKFESIEALDQWLKESNRNISDIEVYTLHGPGSGTTTTIHVSPPGDDDSINVPSVFEIKDVNIEIKSLSESPKIKIEPLNESISEKSQNIWYVDDYESLEGACSTSKIIYKDNTLLMNVCESEGVSTVNLIVEVDKQIHKFPFILKKSCNNDTDHDMIIFL